jgi:hypothetical protein
MLSVEGADISKLSRANDNHGKGFFNSIGIITESKKILKEEDCENDRHKYYWNKVKSPYIYARGYLHDDEDHPNARAAAAILRNIHKSDCPLKLKASVEGGVIQRGLKDEQLLARTKIHSVALTFTPANQATLVEPLNLAKSDTWEEDKELIKSVMHLVQTDVPSFRHITRVNSAGKLSETIEEINRKLRELSPGSSIPSVTREDLVKSSIEYRLNQSVERINSLIKALTAGYGGVAAPTNRTGGSILQAEALDDGRSSVTPGFRYITCNHCGHEQVHMANQVKCRNPNCGKAMSFENLYRVMVQDK